MNVLLKLSENKTGVIAYVGIEHGEGGRFQPINAYIGKNYAEVRRDVNRAMKELSRRIHKF